MDGARHHRLAHHGPAAVARAAGGASAAALNADLFNIANTIPNSLYILVAGGIFNVVLVPQLVRAMKNDPDGGDAYANRIITLGLLVLGVGDGRADARGARSCCASCSTPTCSPTGSSRQRESAYLLMLLCMPQVFFYGAFVLVGQVLNARGRFGPMMWAPIVNNLVALAVLGAYAVIFGVASTGADGASAPARRCCWAWGRRSASPCRRSCCCPFLRRAGFRFRPRFDFRGVGLGHTLRLGAWTLAFIIANQIAFIVVAAARLAAPTRGREAERRPARAQAVYEIGFLISQVPHGVITVSLATAIIPTLAALRRRRTTSPGCGSSSAAPCAWRSCIIAPIAVAVACLGPPMAIGARRVRRGIGATPTPSDTTIAAFALAHGGVQRCTT